MSDIVPWWALVLCMPLVTVAAICWLCIVVGLFQLLVGLFKREPHPAEHRDMREL